MTLINDLLTVLLGDTFSRFTITPAGEREVQLTLDGETFTARLDRSPSGWTLEAQGEEISTLTQAPGEAPSARLNAVHPRLASLLPCRLTGAAYDPATTRLTLHDGRSLPTLPALATHHRLSVHVTARPERPDVWRAAGGLWIDPADLPAEMALYLLTVLGQEPGGRPAAGNAAYA